MISIIKADEQEVINKTNWKPTLERWTFSESTNDNLDVETCMLMLLGELSEAWARGRNIGYYR